MKEAAGREKWKPARASLASADRGRTAILSKPCGSARNTVATMSRPESSPRMIACSASKRYSYGRPRSRSRITSSRADFNTMGRAGALPCGAAAPSAQNGTRMSAAESLKNKAQRPLHHTRPARRCYLAKRLIQLFACVIEPGSGVQARILRVIEGVIGFPPQQEVLFLILERESLRE